MIAHEIITAGCRMDLSELENVLAGTLSPDQNIRKSAELHLKKIEQVPTFCVTLLKLMLTESAQPQAVQAAAINFKNIVSKHWKVREDCFTISDVDKNMIRQNFLECVVKSNDMIRKQLCVCAQTIAREDYPFNWPGIMDQIVQTLSADSAASAWLASLLVLHQIVKKYEYKKLEDRDGLNKAMTVVLPVLFERLAQLHTDDSELSVTSQKMILKIIFCLIQFRMPAELFPEPVFGRLIQNLQAIMSRPVPKEVTDIHDKDELPNVVWWKLKKWAMHLMTRIFERYGNTTNISKEYKKLGHFFSSQFAVPVLNTLLVSLAETNQGNFMSPRVLQRILDYLKLSVTVSVTWKVLKTSILEVIQKVVFPLLCHTDEDEELWTEDPYEYIRMKFDIFEDYVSPVTAALNLLEEVVTKRKNMLNPLLIWAAQILGMPPEQYNPRVKDGAMHLIGAVAEKLLKKAEYSSQLEQMLQAHVYGDFNSSHGFLRARACWTIQRFAAAKFSNRDNLKTAFEGVRVLLLNDKELPVTIEASFALQSLLQKQPATKDLLAPHVGNVIQKLLVSIKETENEDLTYVMQELIEKYSEDIHTVAVPLVTELVKTFQAMLEELAEAEDEDNSSYKTMTAMGILNTIQNLLSAVSQNKKIMPKIENILAELISTVLKGGIVDYYEEIFQMIQILTALRVTSVMWNVLFQMYEAFKNDGHDYFPDMMGALHNYATVDSSKFLSNPQYIEIMYNISKTVLKKQESEDPQYNALKLVEVIIVNHRGKIDHMLHMFMSLALDKLAQSVQTQELRAMALLVVVAAIWYNPLLAMHLLDKYKLPNSSESVVEQFFNQLFSDAEVFIGIHDKKVAVLGLCELIMHPSAPKPFDHLADKLIPYFITLLKNLRVAYQLRREEENEESEGEEGEEAGEGDEELESEDDEWDDEGTEYLTKLEEFVPGDMSGMFDLEHLECFDTILDDEETSPCEFTTFKRLLEFLMQNEGGHEVLMKCVDDDLKKDMESLIQYADRETDRKRSEMIENQGGYNFENSFEVPSTFNF
ncbi:importin-7-like [Bolinopsis microptera]|uniref:importin-7-like n=1 Tax=Bolinopsis microptera TaxID=2820187 RepID=UPI003079EBF5